jgi:hypothetical protein
MPPEQIYLLEKLLTWPTSHSLEDEWRRRNAAAEAVTLYCPVLEGGPLRGRPKRVMPSDGFDDKQTVTRKHATIQDRKSESRSSLRDALLREAEEHIRTAVRPQRCFQCYGDPLLPDNRRTQEWTEYKSTIRHFQTKHLKECAREHARDYVTKADINGEQRNSQPW